MPSIPFRMIWYYSRLPVVIVVTFILFLYLVPALQELTIRVKKSPAEELSLAEIRNIADYAAVTRKSLQNLEKKLSAMTPYSPYLVINTSQNDFYLYRNQKLIRQGKCSTGSYVLLEDGNQQKWMFETPKGKFRIQGKTTSPVWKKPDWAFVESGLPVPPQNHSSRYEYGVLGDYALSLGDGYLIHGTIYKRFLGLPVTHGCIRLNDEDLEAVYRTMPAGSRVYIY
jgi:L,D-transpeptidase YbiS